MKVVKGAPQWAVTPDNASLNNATPLLAAQADKKSAVGGGVTAGGG